jgi:hypothetical protein
MEEGKNHLASQQPPSPVGRRKSFRKALHGAAPTPASIAFAVVVLYNGEEPPPPAYDQTYYDRRAAYYTLVMDLMLFSILGLIGSLYLHSCAFDVPLWLMVMGFGNIAFTLIRFYTLRTGGGMQCDLL